MNPFLSRIWPQHFVKGTSAKASCDRHERKGVPVGNATFLQRWTSIHNGSGCVRRFDHPECGEDDEKPSQGEGKDTIF